MKSEELIEIAIYVLLFCLLLTLFKKCQCRNVMEGMEVDQQACNENYVWDGMGNVIDGMSRAGVCRGLEVEDCNNYYMFIEGGSPGDGAYNCKWDTKCTTLGSTCQLNKCPHFTDDNKVLV